MSVAIRLTKKEEAKALPILYSHSPGMVLPGPVYVISPEAAEAIRAAGVKYTTVATTIRTPQIQNHPAIAPDRCAGAIWSRILDTDLPLSVAKGLITLKMAEEDQDRARKLAAKVRDGTITPEEEVEIREIERAGTILGIMKSKARVRLKRAAQRNGTGH